MELWPSQLQESTKEKGERSNSNSNRKMGEFNERDYHFNEERLNS